MTFLDTNVLVYAADDTDEAKHRRAYDLVVRAIRGESFMWRFQTRGRNSGIIARSCWRRLSKRNCAPASSPIRRRRCDEP